ncbi:MAG TPA: Hpt domain-containing protein, partial [Eudoraea sp.]|nr:Hpt domain-containing protein [Eudoraea sp.]
KPPGCHKEPEIQQSADFATTGTQKSKTGHHSEASESTGALEATYLTYEQINYLNAVLASSDIAGLVGRDLNAGAEKKSAKQAIQTKSDRSFKTMDMGNARKIISKTVQPDKGLKGASTRVDLTPVLEDCLGQLDLLEELVLLFKQNALEFIGQLKIHLQNMDFEGVRFAAHKIKSGLRMMKTTELLGIAEQIEAVCKTDRDVKHLNFLFDCFLEEYPKIEIAIDMALEKLK